MSLVLYSEDADPDKMSAEDELVWNLIRAQTHAQQALDMLYGAKGRSRIKRGLFYRLRVGRAQSNLMTTVVQELALREKHREKADG